MNSVRVHHFASSLIDANRREIITAEISSDGSGQTHSHRTGTREQQNRFEVCALEKAP